MRGEGGAAEGLINHSCIVIDFLLKAVSQTLNYVFVCVCCSVLAGSTESSITALHFPKVWQCGAASAKLPPPSPHFLIFFFFFFFFIFSYPACSFKLSDTSFAYSSTITAKRLIIHVL